MFSIPEITPLSNLLLCQKTLDSIYEYMEKNWAIGQLYPSGGADGFTYFFSIRGIKIMTYLVGTISIGNPSAYVKNIEALKEYIRWAVCKESRLVNEQICKIKEYQSKNWAIGELYPDSGPDEFVIFFGKRNLIVQPYLRGTVNIGNPTAYDENIKILREYLQVIHSFCS